MKKTQEIKSEIPLIAENRIEIKGKFEIKIGHYSPKNQRLTNGIRYAACSAAPGFRSPRSFRYAPFPRLTPTTFCQPWSCYASPYSGWQNVVYLERYTKCQPKILQNL